MSKEKLEILRNDIDWVDEMIVDFLLRRQDLVGQVAEVKMQENGAIRDPERERGIIDLALQRCDNNPCMKKRLSEIFRLIMEASREEQQLRIKTVIHDES